MAEASLKIKMTAENAQAVQALAKIKSAVSDLKNFVGAGIGINIGQKISEGIQTIPAAFANAIKEGVRFNATLQQAQLGIAATLKNFNPQIKDFSVAMLQSASALDQLKRKAIESPASFESLANGLKSASGAASEAGLSVRQQIELVTNMSQAVAGLGLPEWQLPQEMRAILTGNIDRNALVAKTLGITNQDIENAKKQGNLYDFLSGKLATFAEAGKNSSKTFTTALSNLGDAFQQTAGELTKPLFETLTKSFLELTDVVKSDDFKSAFSGIVRTMNDALRVFKDLSIWVAKNADVFAVLGAGIAALTVGGVISAMVGWVVKLGSALYAAATAASTFSLAFKATGIGLIVTGLAAVATVAWTVANRMQAAREEATRMRSAFNQQNDAAYAEIGTLSSGSDRNAFVESRQKEIQKLSDEALKSEKDKKLVLDEQIKALEQQIKTAQSLTEEAFKQRQAEAEKLKFYEQSSTIQKQASDTLKDLNFNALSPDQKLLEIGQKMQLEGTGTSEAGRKALDAALKQAKQLSDDRESAVLKAEKDFSPKIESAEAAVENYKKRVEYEQKQLELEKAANPVYEPSTYNLNSAKDSLAASEKYRDEIKKSLNDTVAEINNQYGRIIGSATWTVDDLQKRLVKQVDFEKQSDDLNKYMEQQDKSLQSMMKEYDDGAAKRNEQDAKDKQSALEALQKNNEKIRQMHDENDLAYARLAGTEQLVAKEQELRNLQHQRLSESLAGNTDMVSVIDESIARNKAETEAIQEGIMRDRQRIALNSQLAQSQQQLVAIQNKRSGIEAQIAPQIIKDRQLVDNYGQQKMAIQGIVDVLQTRRNELEKTGVTPETQEEFDRLGSQIESYSNQIQQLDQATEKLRQQYSLVSQLKLGLDQMFSQYSLSASGVARVLTDSLTTAVTGVSKALTDAIFNAKSFGEAFLQVADQVIQQIIQMTIQMTIFSALQAALGAASGGGVGAGAGLLGGLLGFDEGGLVPGVPSSRDNRLARVATGEYVVRASAVQHYGAGLLHAINNFRVPRLSMSDFDMPGPSSSLAFATGGLVGPSAPLADRVYDSGRSQQGTKVDVAFVNTRQEFTKWQNQPGSKKIIYDVVQKRQVEK